MSAKYKKSKKMRMKTKTSQETKKIESNFASAASPVKVSRVSLLLAKSAPISRIEVLFCSTP